VHQYVTSTIALIGKVLRQPAMGEILQHVQDAARCTQNMQRDIMIIKNSVGLSSTPIGAANFGGNRKATTTWAQVAVQAKGGPKLPPPAPQSTAKTQSTVTSYKDRGITVGTSIRNNSTTKQVNIITAHQLKSGDIQIFTSTTAEAAHLKQNKEWLRGLGERAELIIPTYKVIAHGTSTSSINVKDQKATIQQILADNYTVIPGAEITY
ncbi:hypothetical protein LX36DRAFT_553411, partial [Colletotrichum falcatum]